MAQKFLTEITLQALNNATTDTDKFLVSDSGTIKFRTGTQMLSDIVGYTPANDANVVHTTGNESIAGIKTFTQGVTTFSNASNYTLAFIAGAVTTAEIAINTTFTQFTTYGSFGYLFNGYSGGAISNLLTLDQSGNGVFNANVRATSFTDKDNTLYYLNPASSSNLYDVTANKFVKQGGTSAEYLMADGSVSTGPSLTGYVPTSRTLTINGVTYDLSANRSWTVSVTETDTLATVTGRGASTSTLSNFDGGLTAAKASKTAYGIQLKGAFYGAPRLQLYDLAVDGNAFLGLGVDMSTNSYEFSNYFPRVGSSGRWSVGSWAGDFGTGQYVSGYNEKLWVNENAAQFNVNLGAPLFYDSNNSAYYLDPSATSNLVGLTVANTISGNISGTAGSETLATVTGRGSTTSTGVGFNNYVNILGQNSIYWYNSSNTSYARTYFDGGTFNLDKPLWVTDSIYGDTFYDRNDTNYYVNPAGSSNVGRIFYNNYLVSQNQGGLMGDYNISGTSAKCIWTIGESWPLGNMYGLAYEYSPGTYWHHLALKNNGITYARLGFEGNALFTGNVTTPAQFVASSFADYDNTGYYLNPASTSNIVGLTVANTISGNISGNATYATNSTRLYASDGTYVYGGANPYYMSMTYNGSANRWRLAVTPATPANVEVAYADSSGSAYGANSLYITGYGSSNMTYYQGPGTFAGYSGWAGYLVSNHGDGATYYNQTIITPFWGRPQYSRQQGSTTIYGPYTFWTSEDTITSSYNISAPVFQDYNNTSYYIDPASSSNIDSITTTRTRAIRAQSDGDYTTAALWTESYSTTTTGIAFHISGTVGKFLEMRTNGILYWNGDILLNSSNYTSYAVPTSRTLTINGTTYDLSANRSWTVSAGAADFNTLTNKTGGTGTYQTSGDFRAPIFYDSNDTAYYINPADADISAVLKGTVTIGGGTGGNYDEGLRIIDSGSFSVIAFGATGNTGPGRFNLLKTSGDTFQLRNAVSSVFWETNQSGNTTFNVDVRTPILYDLNDTTYYLDLNNATTAINTVGKIQFNIGASTASTLIQSTGSYGTMSINTYYGVLHTSGDFYIGNPAGGAANLYGNNATFNIFYDRNNTAYYVDAASTSNILGLTVTNTISGNINGNAGTVSTITNRTNLMVNSLAAPALIDGLTTTNFRSTLFGTTNNGYQISTARWNNVPGTLSGLNAYGTMIAWSGSDTQGFLAIDYTAAAAKIGGGNGNNINWSRRVLIEDSWTNSKYFSSGGEIYAPVFYDANDSSFYFDGAETGDSIRCAGDIVAYYSDERLKDRKGNIENALEKVLSLNGFYYEPNETAQALGYKKKLEVGVSAQEVQAILPEIIKDAPIGGDYKTLDYGRLTPLLIEAIKEQQQQIDELKELVNKLINK